MRALGAFWPVLRHTRPQTPDSVSVGAVDAPEQALGDTGQETETVTLHVHGSAGVPAGKTSADVSASSRGVDVGGIAGDGATIYYAPALPTGARLVAVSVAYECGSGAVLADLDLFGPAGKALAHWHPVAGGADTLTFQLPEPVIITDALALAVTIVFVPLSPTVGAKRTGRPHVNQHWCTITGVSVTITS